jgi:hypothetical protein
LFAAALAGFATSDIDIFIHGLSPEESSRKLQTVLAHLTQRMKDCRGDILASMRLVARACLARVQVSPHSVTLLGLFPHRHIQAPRFSTHCTQIVLANRLCCAATNRQRKCSLASIWTLRAWDSMAAE